MSHHIIWRYCGVFLALLIGAIYTLPNFLDEVPSIQILKSKNTVQIDQELQQKTLSILKDNNIQYKDIILEKSDVKNDVIKIRFKDLKNQTLGKDILENTLNNSKNLNNPNYVVASSFLSNTPNWLRKIGAIPMHLGLDLKGGVHFLLQVEIHELLQRKRNYIATNVENQLKNQQIKHGSFYQNNAIVLYFSNAAALNKARIILERKFEELEYIEQKINNQFQLIIKFKDAEIQKIRDSAIQQNIRILYNRINGLGIAEPIIQKQGDDQIIVQLPGIQDTTHAKNIIGRIASLEARLVVSEKITEKDNYISDVDVFKMNNGQSIFFKKSVIFDGNNIVSATAGFDSNQKSIINIILNKEGGIRMRETTRKNIGQPIGIILFEKDKNEVLTVATIQDELSEKFQITGQMNIKNANDLALLLRSGSLSSSMHIIEEKTIGPSLGLDNIHKGVQSIVYGFLAIAIFMIIYYALFGFFSVVALLVNLLLLTAVLSFLQATLTLPGIAAMALTLGMSIDSNVLINERIREEIRKKSSPRMAIVNGFEKAWGTILDSNITTLIVGLGLLIFGSGPVRGFAIVHSLGIITSMFSAVFFFKSTVKIWYGRKMEVKKLSIG